MLGMPNMLHLSSQTNFSDTFNILLLNFKFIVALRDGPFDIQGEGGWDFSSRQVIFFSLFAQQVIFSKVNCNKFFIFEKITH